MEIDIRPYQSGDELKIEPVEDVLKGHPDFRKMWDRVILPEYTWTRYAGDKILGLGGFIPYEDNAYVWIWIDKHIVNENPSIIRGIEAVETLEQIVKFAESFRFSYIWTYVKDGFRKGHKLAKFLGFEKICQVETYWRYERRSAWLTQ